MFYDHLNWRNFKGGLRKDDLVKSMAALHYFFRYACIYLGRLHNYYRVSIGFNARKYFSYLETVLLDRTGHCHRWIRQSWTLDSPTTCQWTYFARDGQVYTGKSIKSQSPWVIDYDSYFCMHLQLEKNSLALQSKKLATIPLSQ